MILKLGCTALVEATLHRSYERVCQHRTSSAGDGGGSVFFVIESFFSRFKNSRSGILPCLKASIYSM